MLLVDPEELITTTEAATLAQVTPAAIRVWVNRGHLRPTGRDHRGRNLYRLVDVARAELYTRGRARRRPGNQGPTSGTASTTTGDQ